MIMAKQYAPDFLRIVAVDDQRAGINVIAAHAAKMQNVTVVLATTDPFEGIRFIRENPVDAVFLDMRMDGFEFIEQLYNPPPIVLTTAYEEFALKSYEFGVVDYLLKPVDFAQFARAIHRVEEKMFGEVSAPQLAVGDWDPYIALPVEHKLISADLSDIIALQANRNVTHVHVLGQHYCIDDRQKAIYRNAVKWEVNIPFGELYARLPYPKFIQLHRSHAVALKMIDEFHGGFVKLHHLRHMRFSVSDTYRASLEKLLNRSK